MEGQARQAEQDSEGPGPYDHVEADGGYSAQIPGEAERPPSLKEHRHPDRGLPQQSAVGWVDDG